MLMNSNSTRRSSSSIMSTTSSYSPTFSVASIVCASQIPINSFAGSANYSSTPTMILKESKSLHTPRKEIPFGLPLMSSTSSPFASFIANCSPLPLTSSSSSFSPTASTAAVIAAPSYSQAPHVTPIHPMPSNTALSTSQLTDTTNSVILLPYFPPSETIQSGSVKAMRSHQPVAIPGPDSSWPCDASPFSIAAPDQTLTPPSASASWFPPALTSSSSASSPTCPSRSSSSSSSTSFTVIDSRRADRRRRKCEQIIFQDIKSLLSITANTAKMKSIEKLSHCELMQMAAKTIEELKRVRNELRKQYKEEEIREKLEKMKPNENTSMNIVKKEEDEEENEHELRENGKSTPKGIIKEEKSKRKMSKQQEENEENDSEKMLQDSEEEKEEAEKEDYLLDYDDFPDGEQNSNPSLTQLTSSTEFPVVSSSSVRSSSSSSSSFSSSSSAASSHKRRRLSAFRSSSSSSSSSSSVSSSLSLYDQLSSLRHAVQVMRRAYDASVAVYEKEKSKLSIWIGDEMSYWSPFGYGIMALNSKICYNFHRPINARAPSIDCVINRRNPSFMQLHAICLMLSDKFHIKTTDDESTENFHKRFDEVQVIDMLRESHLRSENQLATAPFPSRHPLEGFSIDSASLKVLRSLLAYLASLPEASYQKEFATLLSLAKYIYPKELLEVSGDHCRNCHCGALTDREVFFHSLYSPKQSQVTAYHRLLNEGDDHAICEITLFSPAERVTRVEMEFLTVWKDRAKGEAMVFLAVPKSIEIGKTYEEEAPDLVLAFKRRRKELLQH